MMWQTWTRATKFSKLPSEVYDPSGKFWEVPFGSLAAWMFDTAVTWLGHTIENALEERVKVTVGKQVEYRPKYSLAKLLHPSFRLPRPLPTEADNPNPWAELMAWAGKRNSGIKKYKYVA